LFTVQGSHESLLSGGHLRLVTLGLHGGHLILLKVLLEDVYLLSQPVVFFARFVPLLSHLLVVAFQLLDAFGRYFVLLVDVVVGA